MANVVFVKIERWDSRM